MSSVEMTPAPAPTGPQVEEDKGEDRMGVVNEISDTVAGLESTLRGLDQAVANLMDRQYGVMQEAQKAEPRAPEPGVQELGVLRYWQRSVVRMARIAKGLEVRIQILKDSWGVEPPKPATPARAL